MPTGERGPTGGSAGPAHRGARDRFDDHFEHPRNAGGLPGAHGTVEVENPVCGDILKLHWIRGSDRSFSEVRFQVFGCPAAIAAGSVLTEWILGSTRERLEALSTDDIAASLGGLARERVHAARLAVDGLREMLRSIENAGT